MKKESKGPQKPMRKGRHSEERKLKKRLPMPNVKPLFGSKSGAQNKKRADKEGTKVKRAHSADSERKLSAGSQDQTSSGTVHKPLTVV
jgi:hypothetical protein